MLGALAFVLRTFTSPSEDAHGNLDADHFTVPLWVEVACGVAIAAGTDVGGGRIINTMGNRLTEIQAPQGFAAESSGASVILASSYLATRRSVPTTSTAPAPPPRPTVAGPSRCRHDPRLVVHRLRRTLEDRRGRAGSLLLAVLGGVLCAAALIVGFIALTKK